MGLGEQRRGAWTPWVRVSRLCLAEACLRQHKPPRWVCGRSCLKTFPRGPLTQSPGGGQTPGAGNGPFDGWWAGGQALSLPTGHPVRLGECVCPALPTPRPLGLFPAPVPWRGD